MTQQEFTERTGFYPTTEQFENIHKAYLRSEKDKDEWCKEWKRNGGIELYSKESALEVHSLREKIETTKAILNEQIVRAYELATNRLYELDEAKKRIIELEAEAKKWKDVVEAIRMSIPKE